MSSFLLYLDNKIMVKGLAYSSVGTNFYKINTPVNGYVTYAAPYKQIVADQSVGAPLFTGLYINNNYVRTCVSGLAAINYNEGQLYFTSDPNTTSVSGNYSIKNFDIYLTDRSDQEILFETKYTQRPKTPQTMSGLTNDQIQYPCIFLKHTQLENEPYELGGNELTTVTVEGIVMSDSQYKLDAILNICSDLVRTNVALFNWNEWPYDGLGNYRSGVIFNYNAIAATKNPTPDSAYINNVKSSKLNYLGMKEFSSINPNVYPALIEFELVKMRRPRS